MTHVSFAITTLLNGIWQGALLAFAIWLFLKLSPRLNSTTRFTVLWITLLAIVALPLGPIAQKALVPLVQTQSPAAAARYEPSPAAPVDMQQPEFGVQNPDKRSESHPVLVAKSKLESPTQRAPELVEARRSAFQNESPAIAAVEHPLIPIYSGWILGTLEILWALLSFVMLVRLALGYRKLRKLKADASPASLEWQLRMRGLGGKNGVRRPTQLLVSNQIATPTSLGFLHPAILIPRALLDNLSDSEIELVILHELGHLRRRDDWTNLAQKLIEAMLPMQPAVYWIGHRMSIEREMACDDWVIAATGAAEPYATSLTKVAELSQWAHAGILAAGATGNRSQLFRRVRHMLDRTRNPAPKLAFGPLGVAITAIGTLIFAGARAPQLFALAQAPAAENSKQELSSPQSLRTEIPKPAPGAPLALPASLTRTIAMNSEAPAIPAAFLKESAASSAIEPTVPSEAQQSGVTHMEMTTRNGSLSLSVKIDGAIEFTDDDQDVKSLSPGGHFRIEDGTLFSRRTYDVKADSEGNLTKTYSVGSSVRPLDSDGRAWLATLMPQMIRDSGVGAGPRVARILRQGGPQAVIGEIRLIHSDGSKRTYLEQLFAQASLNTEQFRDAAKLIRGISSDGDKAQVLIDEDGKYFTRELRPDLFEAVESISSDGDKRRVLSDILKKDGESADTAFSTARAAKHISSDGDKAEVLIEMANSYRGTGGVDMAYFEAVKSISSDGDHARVLLKILDAHGDDRDTLARVLGSAAKISSDGDKARVLKDAVGRYRDDDLIRKAFIEAANSISSDGDHQQVLVALVHRQGISAATVGEIAKSAQRISSDGDKARVLVDLVRADVEPVRDNFIAATDSIHSDGDHSRVLLALLDKPGTTPSTAIAAIQSAAHISSEGDAGRVLMDAAHRYSKDPSVDVALRKAVETLHSDGTYRSVMSEINRNQSN